MAEKRERYNSSFVIVVMFLMYTGNILRIAIRSVYTQLSKPNSVAPHLLLTPLLRLSSTVMCLRYVAKNIRVECREI